MYGRIGSGKSRSIDRSENENRFVQALLYQPYPDVFSGELITVWGGEERHSRTFPHQIRKASVSEPGLSPFWEKSGGTSCLQW